MLRQALEREKVDFHLVNLREFGQGNYRQTDDTPFGGGAGMVMMAEPLIKAIEDAIEKADALRKEMEAFQERLRRTRDGLAGQKST